MNAQQALERLAEESVDILLTDVVLPGGVSGPELASQVVACCPDVGVVFMSGYTADAIGAELGRDVTFLRKPFRRSELAGVLERVALKCHEAKISKSRGD